MVNKDENATLFESIFHLSQPCYADLYLDLWSCCGTNHCTFFVALTADAYWSPYWFSAGWCGGGEDASLLPFWEQRHISKQVWILQPTGKNQHQPHNTQVRPCCAFRLQTTPLSTLLQPRMIPRATRNSPLTGSATLNGALRFLWCQIICHMLSGLMFYLCALCPRLLEDHPEFVFIPRRRQELPANFPEDIPGVCYFLEASPRPSEVTLKWCQAVAQMVLTITEHKRIPRAPRKPLVYLTLVV